MGDRRRRIERRHLGFLIGVGAVGWLLLALAAPPPAAAGWPPVSALLLFLAVAAGARALAFPLLAAVDEVLLSLDTAIFIASTACLGARVTAIGVALLMAGDAIVRAVRAPGRAPWSEARPSQAAAYAFYLGGLSGGLLALLSRVFDVGRGAESWWRVPVLGASFLFVHYLIQALQLLAAGRPLRAALRRSVTGALAEATLLPLASAIVLIWDPRRPVPFALLGVTYLLMNLGGSRLAHLAAAARRRVLELEALNRIAHALGASLEIPELAAALLREVRTALPRAHVELLVGRGGAVDVYRLDEHGAARVECGAVETQARLRLGSPLLEELPEGPRRARLTAPLRVHGETLGALVAESASRSDFGPAEVRLLDAISGQAAAAVENARLYALANVDGLTGLYCRRYFDARVAEEVERARRFGAPFALVMLDLDHFKRLNDTLGHLAGDRALREVAAIAASQLRGVDLAARFGGEELAFLLPSTSLIDAHLVAERIREAVAGHTLTVEEQRWPITASLGVAGWAEGDDPSLLLKRADAALYRAKSAGRNRVEIDLVNFELTPSLAPVRRRRAH